LTTIVLDTNILISGLFWEGNERKLILLCRNNTFESITSPHILKETNDVLREKFEVPEDKVESYMRDILIFSDLRFPKGTIKVIEEDPPDNYILETAILGKAKYVITGDGHLLNLHSFNDGSIVNTSTFFKEMNIV